MRNRSQLALSVAVLMGGQSLRFGSPKAFLSFKGKSLAAHVLEEAAFFSRDVFCVARHPEQVPPDAHEFPLVTDHWKEEGPLSGLHAALLNADQECLFLTAVDMPFLKREVVEGLYRTWEKEGRPDAVVPRIDGRWEPLCAIWGRTTLRGLEQGKCSSFQRFLSDGGLKVREVSPSELREWDKEDECLKNFNTPQEWEDVFLAKKTRKPPASKPGLGISGTVSSLGS